MDGTLLDDMKQIGRTAAQVLNGVFGTPLPEAELNYYRTTGKPFELQLRELYPEATPFELTDAARKFHDAKIANAYSHASFFPEVPRLLKQLDRAGWVLTIATGAEREMAEVILEREGLGFLFAEIRGAAQGTKAQHLKAYQERWPGLPMVLVGDSRFDMEAGKGTPGVTVVGRACLLPSWAISPADLRRWGASWADYQLDRLPDVLEELLPAVPEVLEKARVPKASAPAPSSRPEAQRRSAASTRGARTYSGDQRCGVSRCRRKANWRWKKGYFCDRHLAEEARSSLVRRKLLRDTWERSPRVS